MPYICDGLSVGVLIFDDADRLLMITRAKAPVGIAPVAGHVKDEHPDWTHQDAAVAEADEEVGLKVSPAGLVEVYARWRPNRCGAEIPDPSLGHDWRVYRAEEWSGSVTRAEAEVKDVDWYSAERVQELADRTIAYAHGQIEEADWQKSPGLEPVWLDILTKVRRRSDPRQTIIRVPDQRDLDAVADLYTAAR
ncbi:NUDIX hydrolase [Nocardiopsis eucommiae]|uniref:NUDIX hydrolase n=1 Tax=Nocardiopsis eucommiae TaxID=2831970 RepID=A0A975QJ81_9ACTN|nr:NUDIX hydrolase [Nocardiopsis eucommiae]